MTAPITWAEASSPIYWSNIGINWNTPAKTETSIFTINNGLVLLVGVNYIAAVSLGVNLTAGKETKHHIIESISYGIDQGYSSFGGFTISGLAQFDITGNITSESVLNAVGNAVYGISSNYINNTKHEETTAMGITMTYSNGDTLLWNPVPDPNDNWSDVTDPNTIWTEETDPTSVWTKIDYPN